MTWILIAVITVSVAHGISTAMHLRKVAQKRAENKGKQ